LIELARALEALLAVLDRLEIPYFVGGSVASGSYGLPRQTNDIDVIADFSTINIEGFCNALQAEYYVDPGSVTEAIKDGRSFNVIHMKAALKFDFFPASSEPFSQSELGRRRDIVLAIPGLENIELPISSPEDTVLAKLLWFRKGGEVSDRQWHDVIGILNVQSTRLDLNYMTEWADRLSISDLLERALRSISRP
jgi:hypothetical protein